MSKELYYMKKSLTYLLAGLLCASITNAAVTNSNNSSNLPNPPAYGTSSGVSLGLMLGLNNTFSGKADNGASFSESIDGASAVSVGFRTSTIGATGYELGVDLETYTLVEDQADISNFGLYANLNYTVNTGAYGFVGINIPNFEQESGASINGTLGYQLGGGYKLTQQFGLELIMKTTKADLVFNSGEKAEIDFKTLGLRGSFVF
jgi:hypothetical protein